MKFRLDGEILRDELGCRQATIEEVELFKQRDDLLAALEGARESLDAIRLAVEPYDDIKPRDWKSDRENLRDAHTSAKETIEAVDTAIASVKSNTK